MPTTTVPGGRSTPPARRPWRRRHRVRRAVPSRSLLTTDRGGGVMLLIGVLFITLAVLRPLLQAEPLHPVLRVVDVIVGCAMICAAGLHSLPGPGRWMVAHGDEVAVAGLLLVAVDTTVGLHARAVPAQGAAFALVMLGGSGLIHDRRYAAAALGAVTLSWFAGALPHGADGDWPLASMLVLCAVAACVVLHSSQRRTLDRSIATLERARCVAVTDELTGLVNRRGLLDALRATLASAPPAGAASARTPGHALMLDVDGLKRVNDTLGHAEGDAMLVAVAGALRLATRPRDVVARLGGDEFTVLLPGASAGAAARVRTAVQAALGRVGVSASIGIAAAESGQTPEQLLRAADAAMYADKGRRRLEGVSSRSSWVGGAAAGGVTTAAPRSAASLDLRDLTVALVGLHVLFLPAFLLAVPGAAGRELAVLTSSFGVVDALFLVATRLRTTRDVVERHVSGARTLMLAIVCVEVLGFCLVVERGWTAISLVVAVVGIGALLDSRFWAAVLPVATVVGWAVIVTTVGAGEQWGAYAMDVAIAPVVAAMVQAVHADALAELRAAQEHANTAAVTDELTGLANRRGFLEAGRPVVRAAGAQRLPASVVFLDLDWLKRVNDAEGHAAGDAMIRSAAQALRECAGEALCARFGGDEFTVLLTGLTVAQVAQVTDRLHAALAARGISGSTGVAGGGRPEVTLDDLVDSADALMYRSRAVSRRGRAAGA